MKKIEILRKIEEEVLVPVIRGKSADEALQSIEAIKNGGISIFEITMTTPNGIGLIKQLSEKYDEKILIGAGTVLDIQTAENCVQAGAKFIVSPILNVDLIKFCVDSEVLMISGALTPTEIFTAWEAGSDIVKIFPISSVGGASYVKAIKAPLPQIKCMVTGGISLENVGEFLKTEVSAIGIGGELVKGTSTEITEKTQKYLQILKATRA